MMTMSKKIRSRSIRIWFDEDDCLIWEGKNLKPSEVALMGAALTEHALKMMEGKPL